MAGEHAPVLEPSQHPHTTSGVRLLCCVMTVDLAVHHAQLSTNRMHSGICVSEAKYFMTFEIYNNEVHK